MEIDALVGAVAEMSRLVDVPTPTIDLVLALVKLRAQAAGWTVVGPETDGLAHDGYGAAGAILFESGHGRIRPVNVLCCD